MPTLCAADAALLGRLLRNNVAARRFRRGCHVRTARCMFSMRQWQAPVRSKRSICASRGMCPRTLSNTSTHGHRASNAARSCRRGDWQTAASCAARLGPARLLPTEVASDTCTSNRHAVSSTSQPSRIHVCTAPQARLATAISSCSIRIRSIRNAPLGLGPQTRAVTIPYSWRPVVKTPPLERTTSARTYTNQLNGGR